MGAAAGIALENGRLQAEQKAHLEELKGSRARVIEAGQKERQRLERNLHDGAQQRLVALSLELSLLEKQLAGDPDARARLDQARREIAVSLDELRAVARGLHPAVLSGHGLEVALQSIAANAPLPVRLTVALEGRLPEPIEVAAYYVVSESLANIGKHAHAESASIDVARAGRDGRRRGRRRRRRRRRHRARLGFARAGRPGGGARRPLARLEPRGRWHASSGGDAMRVAIAEDSVLLREGLARLLGEAGFEVVAQCETADDLLLKVRSYAPTSRSSTSGCRRPTTTRGCKRRSRSERGTPPSACSSCRSTSSSAWR